MEKTGSFIPNQAKRINSSAGRKTKRIYLFTYVSYVLFFGTLLAVAGLFVYELQLKNSLEQQQILLAEERNNFSQSDMVRVQDMEERINAAKRLLDNHAAFSKFFTELERTTIATVQFSDITVERDFDNSFTVMLNAATEEFDSLILQSQILAAATNGFGYEVTGVTYANETLSDEDDASSSNDDETETLAVSFQLTQNLSTADIPYTVDVPVSSSPQTSPAEETSTSSIEFEEDASSVTEPDIQ